MGALGRGRQQLHGLREAARDEFEDPGGVVEVGRERRIARLLAQPRDLVPRRLLVVAHAGGELARMRERHALVVARDREGLARFLDAGDLPSRIALGIRHRGFEQRRIAHHDGAGRLGSHGMQARELDPRLLEAEEEH